MSSPSEHRVPASELAESLGPADVRAAAERIRGRIVATPTLWAPRLDALAPADDPVELFLKAENLQRIGAFKARGALHAVGRLLAGGDPELRRRGIITFSSGNHAQAVALAAREFGIPATIAMPVDAPQVKVAVVRELGAEVVMAGTTSDDRRKVAYAIAAETGASIIQPFDDPDIVCGQGTATLELLDAARRDSGVELDAILVPVGGGGVIAGACLAAQPEGDRAGVPVFSVEPHGCDAMAASLEAGERVRVEPGPTIADGLKPVMVGELNFAIASRSGTGVAGSFRVDDAQLGQAVVAALTRAKILVEPSGAAGIAAALAEAPGLRARLGVTGRPLRCGVIVTGGNVDPALVSELLQRYGDQA